jgi:hypothetical protein
MVHLSIIEARMSQLGFKVTRWFRAEVRELQHVLMDDEKIITMVQGRYFGGYALLVATDRRLLLIDKKALFLNVEDIRYDMISEIDFSAKVFDATVSIFTLNKQHKFTSFKNKHHLRDLAVYAQRRVMELHQYLQQGMIEQAQPVSAPERVLMQSSQLNHPPPSVNLPPAPSPDDVPQLMGSAAVSGTRPWINPYTKTSLTTRRQGSRSWATPSNRALELS